MARFVEFDIRQEDLALFENVLKRSSAVTTILRERLFVEGQDNEIRRLKSYPWKTYFEEFLGEAQILGKLIAPILDTTSYRESKKDAVELWSHPFHIYHQFKGPLTHLEGSFREVLECYSLDDLIDIHSETWKFTKAPELFGMSFYEWEETHKSLWKAMKDSLENQKADDTPFIKERELWMGDIKKYRSLKLLSSYEFSTWTRTTITDIETRFGELPEVKGILVDAMEKATQDLKEAVEKSTHVKESPPLGDHTLKTETLVTLKEVAEKVFLNPRSMTKYKKDWPNPKVEKRGTREAKWIRSDLVPHLRTQFPDINFSDWETL